MQFEQAVSEALPSRALYFPMPQSRQADFVTLPFWGLYLPAVQFLQAASVALPSCSLYFPVPQSVQEASPAFSLYFPAAHTVQTLKPSIQYVPVGQHADSAIEPCLTPENIDLLSAELETHAGRQNGS